MPSALLAGAIAVLASLVVERYGGVIGGVLSTLPTTIVAYAIGLQAHAASVEEFRRALAFVPVGILLNAVYLLIWRWLPQQLHQLQVKRPLLATIAVAMGAWLIAAIGVVFVHDHYTPSVNGTLLCGASATAVLLALGLCATRRVHTAPAGARRVRLIVYLLRGVGASVVVGAAILVGQSGLPIASGMASVFPIIFTTVMVSTWLSQGAEVPAGAAGPMALGSLSISTFSLLAIWLMPAFGPFLGATYAWGASTAGVSLPAYFYLRSRKISKPPASPAFELSEPL